MIKITNLPRGLSNVLAACPSAGAGVHAWLFKCAAALHRAGCQEQEMAGLIADAASGCGRFLEPHEIPDAIRNSRPGSSRRKPVLGRGVAAKGSEISQWPKPSGERIESLVDAPDAPGLFDLWELSPLLCCGWRNNKAGTRTREEWRGRLSKLSLIVPSPMTAKEGRRKSDSQLSPRTLENTGARRFLAVEFDDGRGDDAQAARLWHLNSFSPLVLVVHSGGKSLHGWFYTQGDAESGWHKFMRYAVSIGADPSTWTRCQMVRMPDGMRREPGLGQRRQTVFYFNPAALPC
jgi:hypothetical protein